MTRSSRARRFAYAFAPDDRLDYLGLRVVRSSPSFA